MAAYAIYKQQGRGDILTWDAAAPLSITMPELDYRRNASANWLSPCST